MKINALVTCHLIPKVLRIFKFGILKSKMRFSIADACS